MTFSKQYNGPKKIKVGRVMVSKPSEEREQSTYIYVFRDIPKGTLVGVDKVNKEMETKWIDKDLSEGKIDAETASKRKEQLELTKFNLTVKA